MSDKESKDKKKEMKRADTKRSGFFKGVLDNLRSSVTQLPTGGKGPGSAGDVQDIPEDKLRKELFHIEKVRTEIFTRWKQCFSRIVFTVDISALFTLEWSQPQS